MAKITKKKLDRKLRTKFQLRTENVKLNDLLNPNLGASLSALSQKEVSVKTAFTIAQIMEERINHLKVFDTARKGLIDRFASKDENGQSMLNEAKTEYIIPNKAAYDTEYEALVDIDVPMSVIDRAEIEKLSTLTGSQAFALKALIQ